MGATHDLLTILEVAKKMNKLNDEFHFLFIGGGVQLEKLTKFKDDNKISNVTFLPYQDAEVLPYSFTSADYGIVSLGSGAEGLSVPSKTFYLLAAGVAIIAITETGSEIENLVIKNNCGLVVQPENIDSIFQFLENCDENLLDNYKGNSRKLSSLFTIENVNQFIS